MDLCDAEQEQLSSYCKHGKQRSVSVMGWILIGHLVDNWIFKKEFSLTMSESYVANETDGCFIHIIVWER